MRHVAEQELGQVRKDGKEHFDRLQHELTAAVETVSTEATRLRAAETELALLRAESSRRLAELEERVGALATEARPATATPPRKRAPARRKVTPEPTVLTRAKPTRNSATSGAACGLGSTRDGQKTRTFALSRPSAHRIDSPCLPPSPAFTLRRPARLTT